MKYLLVFLAILLLVWRWRTARAASLLRQQHKHPGTTTTTAMLPCHQCGAYIPEGDAVIGTRGTYCCAAHRKQMEP